MNNKWVVIAGVVLGMVAVGLTHFHITNIEKAQVAKSFLRLKPTLSYSKGDVIKLNDFKLLDLPEDFGPLTEVAVEYTSELQSWFDERTVIATQDISPGTFLLYEHFIDSPDQRFSTLISPGKRGISIPVTTISSVSYFIDPGSRVDVLATLSVSGDLSSVTDASIDVVKSLPSIKKRNVTKTILQNMLVLAVGNATTRGSYLGGSARGYATVTLEVTSEEAEILTFALKEADGGLNLVLRNPSDVSVAIVPDVDFQNLD